MSLVPDCSYFVTLARIVGIRYTGSTRTICHENRSEELISNALIGVDVSKHDFANPLSIDFIEEIVFRTVKPSAVHTNAWKQCDEFDAKTVASLCAKIDVLIANSQYKTLWDEMKQIVEDSAGDVWFVRP